MQRPPRRTQEARALPTRRVAEGCGDAWGRGEARKRRKGRASNRASTHAVLAARVPTQSSSTAALEWRRPLSNIGGHGCVSGAALPACGPAAPAPQHTHSHPLTRRVLLQARVPRPRHQVAQLFELAGFGPAAAHGGGGVEGKQATALVLSLSCWCEESDGRPLAVFFAPHTTHPPSSLSPTFLLLPTRHDVCHFRSPVRAVVSSVCRRERAPSRSPSAQPRRRIRLTLSRAVFGPCWPPSVTPTHHPTPPLPHPLQHAHASRPRPRPRCHRRRPRSAAAPRGRDRARGRAAGPPPRGRVPGLWWRVQG